MNRIRDGWAGQGWVMSEADTDVASDFLFMEIGLTGVKNLWFSGRPFCVSARIFLALGSLDISHIGRSERLHCGTSGVCIARY